MVSFAIGAGLGQLPRQQREAELGEGGAKRRKDRQEAQAGKGEVGLDHHRPAAGGALEPGKAGGGLAEMRGQRRAERLPVAGQRNAAPLAPQQALPERFLERLHPLAQTRLREPRQLGGARELAAVRHQQEEAEIGAVAREGAIRIINVRH